MKFSFFKLLKFYFIALAVVIGLGFASLLLLVPERNHSQKILMSHPYVQEKIRAGFRVNESCGSYRRRWKDELTTVCLEKTLTAASGGPGWLSREVVVRETGSSAPCEYRVLSQTDTLCLPKP